MNKLVTTLLIPVLILPAHLLAGSAELDSHDEDGQESGSIVELVAEAENKIDLQVSTLVAQAIPREISALGEIKLNAYQSAVISPRISGQIVKRHINRGEQVSTGQPLLTLSSIDMAEAQKEFIVSYKEWQRVEALGTSVVSDKRYTETRSEWQFSQSKLLAMGLTKKQLEQLKQNQLPNGEYQILSSMNGTIINDDFIEGEHVEVGTQLFIISDESELWVEAAVAPAKAKLLKIGNKARIVVDGMSKIGIISQIDHQINEMTRTQMVRINISNLDDALHPGQFVTSYLTEGYSEPELAVPEKAITRTSDGDWSVFTEVEKGKYQQTEIEILKRVGDQVIISGLPAGTNIVTNGSFYLAAELAKGGFDAHGH